MRLKIWSIGAAALACATLPALPICAAGSGPNIIHIFADGFVNAADCVVWRKNGGTSADYNTWRTSFGATVGSGSAESIDSSISANVPEPTSVFLLMLGVILGSFNGSRELRTRAFNSSMYDSKTVRVNFITSIKICPIHNDR